MKDQSVPVSRESVTAYENTRHMFKAIFQEIRELSRKKPELTMNKLKVSQVNRILVDIKSFLSDEPEGKYLDLLDDETLPQVGDACVVMAQYEAALKSFVSRHKYFDAASRVHEWNVEKAKRK